MINCNIVRDNIFTIFKDTWPYEVVYPNVQSFIIPQNKIFAKIKIDYKNSYINSLGNASGKKIWTNNGDVIIEIYIPMGNTLFSAYDAAKIINDAYKAKNSDDIIYMNFALNDKGVDGAYSQTNLVISFRYYDIR